ncbi:MAG: protein kinase domain-containing protein [Blastocatellia bacterium]
MRDPERQRHIRELYDAALERRPDERAAFLDKACPGDSLRHEVESLLAWEQKAAGFIETSAIKIAAGLVAADLGARDDNHTLTGRQLGPYKVLSPLGAGGMGEVFLAIDTRLGRRVALKLLPARFTSEADRLRRFEQEARAASSLNHPNIVTVHEIGDTGAGPDARRFLVTEFIEGETLRQRLVREQGHYLPVETALDIAAQVTQALAAAHEAGIIHRDIKPENVMLRRDGYVKVLDFGLAKLLEPRNHTPDPLATALSSLTDPGMVMGTARYMSPEQARGVDVDARTDLWSLGVVLYEMIAGHAPFAGETASDIIAQILTADPAPLRAPGAEIPADLERLVRRALARDRHARYPSAEQLARDLKQLREEISFAAKLKEHSGRTGAVPQRDWRAMLLSWTAAWKTPSRAMWLGLCLTLALLTGAVWFSMRLVNQRWARAQIPRIEQYAAAQNHFAAFDLATRARRYLPDDPALTRLAPTIADNITVVTDPPGARVFLRRYIPGESGEQRQLTGITPIDNLPVARGEYLLYIEKEGFTPFQRTVSSRLYHAGSALMPPEDPTRVEQRLIPAGQMPARMVFVPGAAYKLVGWDKPTDKTIRLDDYFIDQYEVTNQEYAEFIRAGGYQNQQFWRHPFVKDGRALSRDEAMREFRDRTGLPGPRGWGGWAGQQFPAGKADFPVTDITWHEAAAYAAFRGKQLPTIHQWEKAARNGLFTYASAYIMPWGPIDVSANTDSRANFKSGGPRAAGGYAFGVSPFGCHDMAGNVAEWLLNETPDGHATAGASWDDPAYLFAYTGDLPAFHNSARVGFRCVSLASGASGDQGNLPLDQAARVPAYTPNSQAEFRNLLTHYRYDQAPLDARVIETIDTPEWRREKISYAGARDERVLAYLYLPKNTPAPWQVLNFVPAGDVYGGYASMPESLELTLTPYLRARRAVFAVVFRGFREREQPPGYKQPGMSSVRRRDEFVANSTDLRRGLDYLATRPDIDNSRIAYYGFSQGATEGLIYTAVDTRYRAVLLIAGGMWRPGPQSLPEISGPNFAAHIRAPKLLINGRYDEVHSLKYLIEPLYKLLPEPKKLILYDGSHSPPIEIAVPAVNQWLDETLGTPGQTRPR